MTTVTLSVPRLRSEHKHAPRAPEPPDGRNGSSRHACGSRSLRASHVVIRNVGALARRRRSRSCDVSRGYTFLHAAMHAPHASAHALHSACMPACFLHSASQSVHASMHAATAFFK